MKHKQGKNQDDLQLLNRALIMRLIHRMKMCSRSELARQSGLTKATISGITQLLIEADVVKEVGLIDGEKGRRSIGLTLNLEKYLCIGMRLTRLEIRGGLFDIAGGLYAEENRLIAPNASPADAMELMKDIIGCLLKKGDGRRILGVGLALPGPIIFNEEKIAYMSAFPGWESMPIRPELEAAFGIPVRIEHDGVCFAMSEWWERGEEDYRLLLCVLVGQGVGAGVIAGGEPVRGALGCAGEIGHMSVNPDGARCDCGNYGCMEQYASTLALERSMAEAVRHYSGHPLHAKPFDYRDVLRLAREGDPIAREHFERAARYLGYALVNVVNLLNPDIVVVTDSMAEAGVMLLDVLERILRERLSEQIFLNTKLIVKPSNPNLAMQAATSLIVDRFLSSPIPVNT